MMHTVAIIYKDNIAEAVALSIQLRTALLAMGKEVVLIKTRELDEPPPGLPKPDLVITLGGDGTILRAARLAAPQGAVVLGVNLGQLGFLAELGPSDVLAQIPAVVAGNGWVEERMMLRTVVHTGGRSAGPFDGLNDVVVTRGSRPRAVRVSVSVDEQHLQTYVADGVIVSTPTGSTAYALAMEGPIVHPALRSLQITPIAPHLTVIRSMVVPPDAQVSLTLHTSEPAVASIDGQVDTLVNDGDVIEVTASPLVARFVRLQQRSYFYQTLVERLSTTIQRRLL